MILGLLLLLQAGGPDYPLGPLAAPDLTRSEHPLTLTDFDCDVSQADNVAQSMSFRVRLGTFAYLGGLVAGQARGLSFETQRSSLSLSEDAGRYDASASWRARRLLTGLNATRRPPGLGRGWIFDGSLALRLDPDLEILGDYSHDTDTTNTEAIAGRATRSGSLGFLYQRGTTLDASASYTRSRVRSLGRIDLDRDLYSAEATFSPEREQVTGSVSWEVTGGRLPRHQGLVELSGSAEITRRLVLDASARHKWEPGIGSFESSYGGGLSFFGRPHTFAGSREAAERTLELTRRAWELGINERRVAGDSGRRALRERLALSPRRDELRPLIDALYAAQVAERNVPQAGVTITRSFSQINDTTTWEYHFFAGVPWRPAWPWRSALDAVEFLRAEYTQTDTSFAGDITASDRSLSVEASLNREMSLRFRWSQPGATPADLIRLSRLSRQLELEYVYAKGR